jgi:NADP-dependent 3-hydroxy acid dehydrogenase YdfG
MPRTQEHYDVNGRTVFITGAARGIGAATAERLYGKGANVALVGLEPELLEQNAARLGDRAAVFPADVTDLAALEDAVAGGRWPSTTSASGAPIARSSRRSPSGGDTC